MSGIHVENTFSQRQGEDEEYAIACLQTVFETHSDTCIHGITEHTQGKGHIKTVQCNHLSRRRSIQTSGISQKVCSRSKIIFNGTA